MSYKIINFIIRNQKTFKIIGIIIFIYLFLLAFNFISKIDDRNVIKGNTGSGVENVINDNDVLGQKLDKIVETYSKKIKKDNTFQYLDGIDCKGSAFVIGNTTELKCKIIDKDKYNFSISILEKIYKINKNEYIYNLGNILKIKKDKNNIIFISIEIFNKNSNKINQDYLEYILLYTNYLNSLSNISNNIENKDMDLVINYLKEINVLTKKNKSIYKYKDYFNTLYFNGKTKNGKDIIIDQFPKEINNKNYYIIYAKDGKNDYNTKINILKNGKILGVIIEDTIKKEIQIIKK